MSAFWRSKNFADLPNTVRAKQVAASAERRQIQN